MPTAFLSLNGPDNVGKTTQIEFLAEARPSLQFLGSVHEHAPHLWRVLPYDLATWWFETSSTPELTRLLFESHRLRAEAREPGGIAVIDRGHAMLTATAVTTCVVKDRVSIDEARLIVAGIRCAIAEPPREYSILLLISQDAEESLAVSQRRSPSPWGPRYLHYQRTLHQVLIQQADDGTYDRVIECGRRRRSEIHSEILAAVDGVTSVGTKADHEEEQLCP